MTREQANKKARAWLLETHYYQFGGIVEEEEINSLATLLLATEAACLEEAAKEVLFHAYAKDFAIWANNQAAQRRQA